MARKKNELEFIIKKTLIDFFIQFVSFEVIFYSKFNNSIVLSLLGRNLPEQMSVRFMLI